MKVCKVIGTVVATIKIDHLDGRKFLQDAPRRQAGGQGPQPVTQCHVQAVRQEAHEDMRLDASWLLVEDRPDRQIALEVAKGLFHLHHGPSPGRHGR